MRLTQNLKVTLYLIITAALLWAGITAYSKEPTSLTNTPAQTIAVEGKTYEPTVLDQEEVGQNQLKLTPYTYEPLYRVVSVSDGDTITVEIDGKKEKIRMIGVDTPESVDPRKPVQCFGREASDFTKSQLTNQLVHLVPDETQDDRDKYSRLLRYVYLPDGTLYNQLLIAQGYAHEYTYNIPYIFQKEFKAAQQIAQKEGRGLWSTTSCNGQK